MSLTEAGQAYYERCLRVLEEVAAADDVAALNRAALERAAGAAPPVATSTT